MAAVASHVNLSCLPKRLKHISYRFILKQTFIVSASFWRIYLCDNNFHFNYACEINGIIVKTQRLIHQPERLKVNDFMNTFTKHTFNARQFCRLNICIWSHPTEDYVLIVHYISWVETKSFIIPLCQRISKHLFSIPFLVRSYMETPISCLDEYYYFINFMLLYFHSRHV